MKTPPNWRKGQTIFNFLEWLNQNGICGADQSTRMGDPFHLTDKEWNDYYLKFFMEVSPLKKLK